jgi:hypothetical protein
MAKKNIALIFLVLSSLSLHSGEVLSGRFAPSAEHESLFRSRLSIEMPRTTENTDAELILSVTYTEMPSTEDRFREEVPVKLTNIDSGDVLIRKASLGGSLNFWVVAEVLEFEESRYYIFHNCVIPHVVNSNLGDNDILQLIRLKKYQFNQVDFPIISKPTFLKFQDIQDYGK